MGEDAYKIGTELNPAPSQLVTTFEVATIVQKCLNGRAPMYLSNDLQYNGQRRTGMLSASAALLEFTFLAWPHQPEN